MPGASSSSLLPTSFLATIFLDNGKEREGKNIERNIATMMRYVQGERVDPSDAVLCRDSAVLQRLVEASRAAAAEEEGWSAHGDTRIDNSGDSAAPQMSPIRCEPPTPLSSVLHSPVAPSSRHPQAGPQRGEPSPRAKRITTNTVQSVGTDDRSGTPTSTTRFISTVRGMYGDALPEEPRYVQDRRIAVHGLRRQVAETNATDEALVGEDEDNHLNAAPSGLSRILKTDSVGEEEQTMATTCPHCDLSREDPPVFQMVLPTTNKAEAKASSGGGDTASVATGSLHARSNRFKATVKRRYGNLALGILTPSHTMDNLWNLVAMLQPPKPLQLLNHPPNARSRIPQLSLDEWAMMASSHFSTHVGAAPWQEYFVRRRTELQEWTRSVQADCDAITAQIRESQKVADRLKFRSAALERVVDMRDPMGERQRLQQQLTTMQQELIMQRWDLEDAQKRTERDRLSALKGRALVAVTQEEIRRLMAQVADLVNVAATLNLSCHQSMGKKARETVLSILEELPTARGASVKRILSSTHDAHQCPNCLMLTVSSPYCPMTGEPHGDLLSNLFEELSMGGGPMLMTDPMAEINAMLAKEEAALEAQRTNAKGAPQPLSVAAIAGSPLGIAQQASPAAVDGPSPPATRKGQKTNSGGRTLKPVSAMNNRAVKEEYNTSASEAEQTATSTSGGAKTLRRKKEKQPRAPRVTESQRRAAKAQAAAEAARQREIRELLGSSSDEDDEDGGDLSADDDTPPRDQSSNARRRRHRKTSVSSVEAGDKSGGAQQSDDQWGSASFHSEDDDGGIGRTFSGMSGLSGGSSSPSRRRRKERRDVFERLKEMREGKGAAVSTGGAAKKNAAAEPPSTVALEVMSNHMWRYLAAAADKNFPAMRQATRELGGPACSLLFTDVTLRSLAEAEEQFYSWYSIVGQLLPANEEASTAALVRKAKSANYKVVEQRCLTLRKELRNLEYAFHKRPKGRGGALLDDSSFAALALKITDLERRNTALRIKLRQVNEQRRALARSHNAM